MSFDYSAYPILFVDDEPANLVALSYVLEGKFRVLTAGSGDEALQTLATHDDIAIIVCDQRMPGMTGVEVCERARVMRPQVVRMILTAYADLHAAIDAINRGGIDRYITKPFRNEELIETLRTTLDITHLQRTVQDMQVRLFHTGQAHAARTIQRELAHEVHNYLQALEYSLTSTEDAVRGALDQLATDPGRAGDLLREALEIHADTGLAAGRIRAVVDRVKRGEVMPLPVETSCDVVRIIDSTVRILRNEIEKRARVQVTSDAAPVARIDPTAFGQVMMNLLLNATQALVGRGDGVLAVRIGIVDGRCLVSVSDNGPGIATEDVERIFDPFYTTKQGSSGLGLAIVREAVQAAGGRVTVSSEPGKGTRFTVDLALAVPRRASSRPPPP